MEKEKISVYEALEALKYHLSVFDRLKNDYLKLGSINSFKYWEKIEKETILKIKKLIK